MKALFIGLGGVGQRHARNLRALLGNELDILAYRARGLGHVVTPTLQMDSERNVEREYGIRSFRDLDAALAESPQIAFVCNPSSLHVSAAGACVRAGCDLFLEKPVSDSMDGVWDLVKAVETGGRVAMVGYQLRFHPCVQALQDIIKSGVLGSLLAVRALVGEHLPDWHPYEDYRRMYAARADLGGGVVLSQIHEFDYLYSMFGPPRRLFSIAGHWSRLEVDVEDIASTLMECHWQGRSLPVHLQQDYLQRPASRSCEVVGDEGRAVIDLARPSVLRYDRTGKIADSRRWEHFDRNQLFLDEMKHFLECVKMRTRPLADLKDGIWSLRCALAAKDSAAHSKLVELSGPHDAAIIAQ